MKRLHIFCFFFFSFAAYSQSPDKIYSPNIKSVKLHQYGNQLAYPIIKLNSGDRLELHFDDLDANVKNYSFTYQLCNADWSPALLSSFDYIQGFTQLRITNYRISSIAFTKYTHYQAILPDRNSAPSRSGNYLLKVFSDGDPSKVVLTRRFLVIDQRAEIAAQIQQPYNGLYFKTHQKIQFSVLTNKLNLVNAIQQIRVSILQNDRWDNALNDVRATFIRQGTLEYNTENAIFPGGREWRWLDLRSFRLQSDRVEKANYTKQSTEIFVRTDLDRSQQRFVFYRDNNGMYYIDAYESINTLWQADYATVRFSYVPPGKEAFKNREVYLFGEFTDYGFTDSSKMRFNVDKGVYETSLFLKQGYYDYAYVTREKDRPDPSFDYTEGNYWDTENNYMILVYYRALGGRADELIGYTRISSLNGRRGVGF